MTGGSAAFLGAAERRSVRWEASQTLLWPPPCPHMILTLARLVAAARPIATLAGALPRRQRHLARALAPAARRDRRVECERETSIPSLR